MGRPAGSTNQKNSTKEVKGKKICVTCGNLKLLTDFYLSESPLNVIDGKIPSCKSCLSSLFDINNPEESLKSILRQIDKPFFYDVYEASVLENPENIYGKYMKNIVMPQHRGKGYTWESSVFKPVEVEKKPKPLINNSKEVVEHVIYMNDIDFIEKLKDKYGYGYPDEEYMLFEKKYSELKTSFQLLTTMHIEYFKEYCINRVKETLAKAKGDFKQAKEWATMVKDVAEAGKLKPSQMSKADLSGGLDTFGQLARMVEENYEVMPLLPQFTEKPKDKVDVTLWCFINYVRDLKGLPECEYKEIYEFYNKKKEDYESQISDKPLVRNEEDDIDE